MLRKKVQDAGFSVGALVANMDFDNVKVDGNGQAVIDGNVYRFSNVKNKTLNGTIKVTVIDKNFLSSSAFKQKATQVNSDAYATGTGMINGKKTRIYHLSV
ncbi:MAG: hypothetical protein EOO89_09670 [Pedobacter sp.]|nr:MAG: hypothetical protein EOO89_09670 [Pedobacter sp.]